MTTDPGREALAVLQEIVDECAELRRLARDQTAAIAVLRHEHNQMRTLLMTLGHSRLPKDLQVRVELLLERINP